jgi:hypothetical protein
MRNRDCGLGGCLCYQPIYGKSTLALVPDSQILPSAFAQYSTFLKENKVVTGTPDAQRVRTVGMKIKGAAEKWLAANGYAGYLKVTNGNTTS